MKSPKSRFLVATPLARPGEYVLGRQESHHAANVLRHRLGDAVVVFDGVGRYAEAIIVDADRDAMTVAVDGIHSENRLPLRLTIASAIPKGKRWQTLVEKCTELGVDRIFPLLTERGVAKGEGDPEKWRRWIVEAAKQSRRSWLPEITEPTRLSRVLEQSAADGDFLFLADPAGDSPVVFGDELRASGGVTAIIGPEGGLEEGEARECLERGAKRIRLSPFVLRVETAAAVVCAIVREMLL